MATPIPSNTAAFTTAAIVEATKGEITRQPVRASGAPQGPAGVVTDSRAVVPGNIFVAIRGDSHDGHDFVVAAGKLGASVVIVERKRAKAYDDRAVDGVAFVEVDDTLVALGELARVHIERWRATDRHKKVVAITGSAGKTTTKELTAALLGAVGPTHYTAGNLNNRVGVPFVVLGLETSHHFAVLEMGMSLVGELDAITSFARPDVSVVTNVGVAHAEGVGGPDGVMREKGAVYRALVTDGIAIVNADDERVVRAAQGTRAAKVVTFGRAEGATYRLLKREPRGDSGSVVTIAAPGRELTIQLPLPGEAAAIDLAAALAAQETASGAILDAEIIDGALAKVRLEGRASIRCLGEDIVVLDDTYNANPASMRAALATLGEISRSGGPAARQAGERRRVAILGAMAELGAHEDDEHDALGEAIADAGVNLLIGCGGPISRAIARAKARGVTCIEAPSTALAAEEAKAAVRPGDAVLVKGSRSVGAERVVAALIETWPSGEKPGYSVIA